MSAHLPLPAAPGASEHAALDLANSRLVLPGRVVDALMTPLDATEWLVERGLAPGGVVLEDYCASRLRDLRAHARTLLVARTLSQVPAAEAIAAVNEALTTAPTASLLSWDGDRGAHRVTAHPATQLVEHALAALASDLIDLLTGDEGDLLASCTAEPCNRFLVRTHARRHWCSTRCGDRVRAARAYARKASAREEDEIHT